MRNSKLNSMKLLKDTDQYDVAPIHPSEEWCRVALPWRRCSGTSGFQTASGDQVFQPGWTVYWCERSRHLTLQGSSHAPPLVQGRTLGFRRPPHLCVSDSFGDDA